MPRLRLLTPTQEIEVKNRYLAGAKSIEIAALMACSQKTITNVLNRLGVPLRQSTPSEEGRRRISAASKAAWSAGKQPPMLGKTHSAESRERMGRAQSGEKNAGWRGGTKRVKTKDRKSYYIFRLAPDHPLVVG